MHHLAWWHIPCKNQGQAKKLGLYDDLEAYVLDLGDASRVSATISKNFNAVELIGLREMMVHRQHDKIDRYEKEWRTKHKIPEGQASTLVKQDRKAKQQKSNVKINIGSKKKTIVNTPL